MWSRCSLEAVWCWSDAVLRLPDAAYYQLSVLSLGGGGWWVEYDVIWYYKIHFFTPKSAFRILYANTMFLIIWPKGITTSYKILNTMKWIFLINNFVSALDDDFLFILLRKSTLVRLWAAISYQIQPRAVLFHLRSDYYNWVIPCQYFLRLPWLLIRKWLFVISAVFSNIR